MTAHKARAPRPAIFLALMVLLLSLPGGFSVGAEGDADEQGKLAEDLYSRGMEAYNRGDYLEAAGLFEKALDIRDRIVGNDDLDAAYAFNNIAALYEYAGQYQKALPNYERALEIREKILGPDHADTALSVNNLAMLYYNMGDYDKALPLLERARAAFFKSPGPEHPYTATALNNLAALHESTGAYERAEDLYLKSLEIRKKVLGEDHPDTATSWNNLGQLYNTIGKYSRAEELFEKSMEIRKKVLGEDHPDTAQSMNNLASLYDTLGRYREAGDLYEKALAVYQKAYGPEHPNTATIINNLAFLYDTMGDYGRAIELYRKALAIREKALGKDHPDTAASMTNLATLHESRGDYSRAEDLLKEALASYRKSLGNGHPHTAAAVNNLASLYETMGDYPRAEDLYQQALEVCEKAWGEDHDLTATVINNLALLNALQKRFDRAEKLYRRALAIREKVLGHEHAATAATLNHMGALYLDMGDYQKAKTCYQQALAIRKKILGTENPTTAMSLNNLGLLHQLTGDRNKAETLYKQALEIQLKTMGPRHPFTAALQANLGNLHLAKGEWKQAHELLLRALETRMLLAREIFSVSSERQKMLYRRDILLVMDSLLSSALASGLDPEAVKSAYDGVVKSKGMVFDALVGEREALLEEDASWRADYEELGGIRSMIASMYVKGPGPDLAAYDRRMDELTAKKEDLEGRLARAGAAYGTERERARAGGREVCEALPRGTALIDYVQFDRYRAGARDGEAEFQSWMAAFVINGGNCGAVEMVDLGPLFIVKDRVENYRKQLIATRPEPGKDKADTEALAKTGKALADVVWEPVKERIKPRTGSILVSPDGPLNIVPLAPLPDREGRFLLESMDIAYLTMAKDLVATKKIKKREKNALLIGAPDFDLAGQTPEKSDRPAERGKKGECLILGDLAMAPLTGAGEEVERIRERLRHRRHRSVMLTGRAATEENFKKEAAKASLIHLATHGFFLAGSCAELDKSRGMSLSAGPEMMEMSNVGKRAATTENPLLLSGLALAGANKADMYAGENDGVLLALEVANMDLGGVELVVLSACETGLGEVRRGEGVFGLRRSFIMAGARSLVVSLWSVPDQPTQELMVRFYDKMLEGAEPRQALRQAQLEMIAKAREQGRSDHPYNWAAFQYVE